MIFIPIFAVKRYTIVFQSHIAKAVDFFTLYSFATCLYVVKLLSLCVTIAIFSIVKFKKRHCYMARNVNTFKIPHTSCS